MRSNIWNFQFALKMNIPGLPTAMDKELLVDSSMSTFIVKTQGELGRTGCPHPWQQRHLVSRPSGGNSLVECSKSSGSPPSLLWTIEKLQVPRDWMRLQCLQDNPITNGNVYLFWRMKSTGFGYRATLCLQPLGQKHKVLYTCQRENTLKYFPFIWFFSPGQHCLCEKRHFAFDISVSFLLLLCSKCWKVPG